MRSKLHGVVVLFSLLLHVLVKEGGATLAAVVAIVMLRHKAADPRHRAVLPQPNHLAPVLDPVVLEGLEGDGLAPPLGLLWLGEHLLLALLAAAAEAEDEVERGLLLDVVVREGPAVL